MKTYALVTAAGSGIRFGGKLKKQFYEIGGNPILYYTLLAFDNADFIDEIFVTLPEAQLDFFNDLKKKFRFIKPIKIFCRREYPF